MGEYLGLVVDSTHAYIAFTSSLNDVKGDVLFNKVLNPTSELDFGDALSPLYPTLKAQNGACHTYDPLINLGNLIDTENDGQPDPLAKGDDLIGLPDEDGIIFNTPLVPGLNATITVLPSTSNLYLQGWIDFNMNGNWSDPGEQILNNVLTSSGVMTINFTVPSNAAFGHTYARFRLSTVQGLSWIGPAPDGEVEDYRVVISELLDYGDALDPAYPTLFTNNGARHNVVPGVMLGNLIDTEIDGQPNSTATGDNINNQSDEDGVVFNTSLVPGQLAGVTVNSSVNGFLLQGWIDFNADGDWMDPGEQIFFDISVVTGPFQYTFMVPSTALPGQTYARFRLSSLSGLPFIGPAPDGEVEDYLVSIIETGSDFGDAPDPAYPTLMGSNGARHSYSLGVYLGNFIDFESDGQPDPTATGDDMINIADEDGVVFASPLVPGQIASCQVFPSSVNLFLQAWIDFNADGDWADPGEQIINNLATTAGVNHISFNVPADAILGPTYARFRISNMPNLSFTGAAPDGEVEDYNVTIHPFKTLNIKAYLEGLYIGGGNMTKAQDEYGDHFIGNTADVVTIELHNAATYPIIEHTISNVSLGINGQLSISSIPHTLNDNYYITVKHRNSIETTSANPVSFAGNTISYDFSSAASQAYGSNLKNLGGVYVIYSGDVNQDGHINTNDMNPVYNDADGFAGGYLTTDINGDGIVDSKDLILIDNNSSNFVGALLP
jgi:hypothetical protein